jgi:hypothetical protein
MKQLFLTMCLAAATFGAYAQEVTPTPAKQEKKANPNGPKFYFPKGETHDFGTVKEGPSAEYTFEFKNAGKEPLIISNAQASCGCTTPEWPKEPILPGKTGKILVRYNTQGRPGPIDKTVWITSNAVSDKDRYELRIKGNVQPAPTQDNNAPKQ